MILSITGELERKCQLPLGQGEKGKKLKQILVVPIHSSNTKSKKSKLQPKKKKATKDFIHISHTIKTHRILHINIYTSPTEWLQRIRVQTQYL